MAKTRTARNEPKPISIRLMERDLWILEGLMKMRVLQTRQLAKLYFGGSCAAANKRLRKLFDAGFIRSWLRNLSEDNLYTVTRLGIRTLQEQGECVITDTAPSVLDGQLDQVLAMNRLRIAMAEQLEQLGGSLTWWLSDWDLRLHHRERIIPDALFEISLNETAHVVSLEVDNNTRSLKRFVAKMRGYATAREQHKALYGHTEYIVLVVGTEETTTDRYRRSLDARRFGNWVWMTTMDALGSDSAETLIWQQPGSELRYSLQDVLSWPYCKEGFAGSTA